VLVRNLLPAQKLLYPQLNREHPVSVPPNNTLLRSKLTIFWIRGQIQRPLHQATSSRNYK